MSASRRVLFNPTSLPALRTTRIRRRDFGDVGSFTRAGLKGFKKDGMAGQWRSVRQGSTQIGENGTGYITAGTNEGILFFDSKYFPHYLLYKYDSLLTHGNL